MTFTRVMYRLRERQAISSLCPLSITYYKSCAKKEITNDGKWGNGGSEIRKAFRFVPSRGNTDQKEFSLFFYYLLNYIVILHCNRLQHALAAIITTLYSRRVNLSFFNLPPKATIFQRFIWERWEHDWINRRPGSRSIKQFPPFRFSTRFRKIFFGPKYYFKDIKSLLHLWWVCPCIIYDSYVHSFPPSRGAIQAGGLNTQRDFFNKL